MYVCMYVCNVCIHPSESNRFHSPRAFQVWDTFSKGLEVRKEAREKADAGSGKGLGFRVRVFGVRFGFSGFGGLWLPG